MEFLEDAKVSIPFEIFATDISETAIEKARAGIISRTPQLAPCLAAAVGAVLHQNGTRVPDREDHP